MITKCIKEGSKLNVVMRCDERIEVVCKVLHVKTLLWGIVSSICLCSCGVGEQVGVVVRLCLLQVVLNDV